MYSLLYICVDVYPCQTPASAVTLPMEHCYLKHKINIECFMRYSETLDGSIENLHELHRALFRTDPLPDDENRRMRKKGEVLWIPGFKKKGAGGLFTIIEGVVEVSDIDHLALLRKHMWDAGCV